MKGNMASFVEVKGKKGSSIKAIVRIKGYKTKCKSFSNITLARHWAKKIETQMETGEYKEESKVKIKNLPGSNIKTMRELIEYFKKHVAPERYSYAEKYDCMYDWWIEQLGDFFVYEVSSQIVSACKNMLVEEKIITGKKEHRRSNNTINKYLMCLSAVLTYAVKELEIIPYNPCSNVNIMKKPSGRRRFLSRDEIVIYKKAIKEHSDIVNVFGRLLLSTGARYSEVLHLKVENIDFINQQVHYVDTKNKTHRGVYINNYCVEILKNYLEMNDIKSGYIFLKKGTDKFVYMRGYLQKIIKECGFDDFRIHDLRHTFSSWAAMSGASLLDIANALGQKSMTVARIYSHLTVDYSNEIVKKAVDMMFLDD